MKNVTCHVSKQKVAAAIKLSVIESTLDCAP